MSVEDPQKWVEYRGVETASFEEGHGLDEGIQFSGRDADTACKFGEASWSPSAPLTKRGIDSVELVITIDRPTRAVMAESAASSRTTPELLHHSPSAAGPSVSMSSASPSGPPSPRLPLPKRTPLAFPSLSNRWQPAEIRARRTPPGSPRNSSNFNVPQTWRTLRCSSSHPMKTVSVNGVAGSRLRGRYRLP